MKLVRVTKISDKLANNMKRSFALINELPSSKKIFGGNSSHSHNVGSSLSTSPSTSNFGKEVLTKGLGTTTENRGNCSSDKDWDSFSIFEKSMTDKTYFFTGNVERVIKWNKILTVRCYFEVIGTAVSLQDGSFAQQKIILLRDKQGPILQVIYYMHQAIHTKDFSVGDILRCVGYINAPNSLTAASIRPALPEEVTALKRLCHIGDFAISRLTNGEAK